jgi:hypothetical protein
MTEQNTELTRAIGDWAARHPEPDKPVVFIGGKEFTPNMVAEEFITDGALAKLFSNSSAEDLIKSFESSGTDPKEPLYAISVHDGSGSTSEGFDSRGAMGFWSDYDKADSAAKTVYKKIAAVDPQFRDEGDVRVIMIEQSFATIDDFIADVCKENCYGDDDEEELGEGVVVQATLPEALFPALLGNVNDRHPARRPLKGGLPVEPPTDELLELVKDVIDPDREHEGDKEFYKDLYAEIKNQNNRFR